MKDWSSAAGSCSVVEDDMGSVVAVPLHSAVGCRMGSVAAAPVDSVGEGILGSLVDDVVRFSEISADSKLRQCTRRSNLVSQILSQEL